MKGNSLIATKLQTQYKQNEYVHVYTHMLAAFLFGKHYTANGNLTTTDACASQLVPVHACTAECM